MKIEEGTRVELSHSYKNSIIYNYSFTPEYGVYSHKCECGSCGIHYIDVFNGSGSKLTMQAVADGDFFIKENKFKTHRLTKIFV